MDDQLEHLKKISLSKETMGTRVLSLKRECTNLQNQLNEISVMLEVINKPIPHADIIDNQVSKKNSDGAKNNVIPIKKLG